VACCEQEPGVGAAKRRAGKDGESARGSDWPGGAVLVVWITVIDFGIAPLQVEPIGKRAKTRNAGQGTQRAWR